MNTENQWWLARRDLADGRSIFVVPQLYNTKITIGTGELTYDQEWTYHNAAFAIAAMEKWNPESEPDPPIGWFRHIPSHRRRPDGDPNREYIAE